MRLNHFMEIDWWICSLRLRKILSHLIWCFKNCLWQILFKVTWKCYEYHEYFIILVPDQGFKSIYKISFKLIHMCKRLTDIGLSQWGGHGLRPQSRKLLLTELLIRLLLKALYERLFCLFTFDQILNLPHLGKVLVDATTPSEMKVSVKHTIIYGQEI